MKRNPEGASLHYLDTGDWSIETLSAPSTVLEHIMLLKVPSENDCPTWYMPIDGQNLLLKVGAAGVKNLYHWPFAFTDNSITLKQIRINNKAANMLNVSTWLCKMRKKRTWEDKILRIAYLKQKSWVDLIYNQGWKGRTCCFLIIIFFKRKNL